MVFLQTPSILFAYPEVSKCGISSTCAESQKARTLLNAFFTYFCSALKSFTILSLLKVGDYVVQYILIPFWVLCPVFCMKLLLTLGG